MKAAVAIDSATCDRVQQAIAAGEILDDEDHVAGCAACSGVAETARRAAELRAVDAAAPLSPGFRARLMAGSKARYAMRRRRNWSFAALGAAAAAGALWVALWSSQRGSASSDIALPVAVPAGGEPAPDPAEIDALLEPAARWSYVEEPLEPYRQLAEWIDVNDRGGAP